MTVNQLMAQLAKLPGHLSVFVHDGQGIGTVADGVAGNIYHADNWYGGDIACDLEEGEAHVVIHAHV